MSTVREQQMVEFVSGFLRHGTEENPVPALELYTAAQPAGYPFRELTSVLDILSDHGQLLTVDLCRVTYGAHNQCIRFSARTHFYMK